MNYNFLLILPLTWGLCGLPAAAQSSVSAQEALQKIAAAEAQDVALLAKYQPLLEAYVQMTRGGPDTPQQLTSDSYFIGRLELSRGINFDAFVPEKGAGTQTLQLLKRFYEMRLLPRGFAQMTVIDQNFNLDNYEFDYLRGEFLGEIRCLVFDVRPRPKAPDGSFIGRIWVEDQEFHVVRFSGTYTSRKSVQYLHFNTYRQHIGAGLWLPSLIYVEETFAGDRRRPHSTVKGHVRLWGYRPASASKTTTFTNIVVETPQPSRDQSDSEVSRAEALRDWQRQAEENALRRLEKANLLGPEGEVEKVLDTVLNNLVVTNNLAIEPPVTSRVLLTTPLESFTIGHTIILSRGLIDVLPSEASLAAVIARELASIVLGGEVQTKYAFSDQTMFGDNLILREFEFRRTDMQEELANRKAIDLLRNSPYKDKLESTSQFLATLAEKANSLPSLTRPQFGNPVAENGHVLLVPSLLRSVPKTEPASAQLPALPLASRVRVDPWSCRTEMLTARPVALLSAREKMPLEVTPILLQLRRREAAAAGAADR